MTTEAPAYGLWPLVLINAAVFIIFAFSFAHPRTARDWRSFGAFAAFLVALFTEMYGFPLTIYLLSGWLSSRDPGIDLLTHNNGHLWETLLGWGGDPHLNPLHLLSDLVIAGGFFLLAMAWKILYQAQRTGQLATTGPYAYLRHPQYAGFILIMVGFLIQWPTLITLLMFPILVTMYVRLARREEREAQATFGTVYRQYAARTPAFFPRLQAPASAATPSWPVRLGTTDGPMLAVRGDLTRLVAAKEVNVMAKDPVCGMEVAEQTAAATSVYKGTTYYFCSKGCKTAFDKEPEKYLSAQSGHDAHH